jgi:diguanylate cyclase (GGDEF)-like protein/PAS domain S-box-containing protein
MSKTTDKILSTLGVISAGASGPASDDAVGLSDWLRRQVDDAEGPAFVLSEDKRVLAANPSGLDVLDRMTPEIRNIFDQDLAVCLGKQSLVQGQIRVPGDEMEMILDATFLPLPGTQQHGVLVIAKDVTLDHHFRQALVASRRLFKDLVNCSSDFAWETRADGTFSYVSQRGALGYSAIDLDRRLASELLLTGNSKTGGKTSQPAFNPFETREHVGDEEVQLQGRDGGTAVMRVSCVPVFSRNRTWLGARGVCRDITDVRAREKALSNAQERERIAHNIISAIHSELLPPEMLATAVDVVAEEMETTDCWIVKAGTTGEVVAAFGRATEIDFSEIAAAGQLDRLDITEKWFELSHASLTLLFVQCGYGTATKGYLVLGKPLEFGAWSADDHELLADIGNHVGVVISQAELMNQLEELSRTDELTRLLNRRAFSEEVERRLLHAQRKGRPSAMLYLDLDNFKAVNDLRGHADGDYVLRVFAKKLRESSRVGDYAGRIGGDEFVMWLEETDAAGAENKARSILESFQDLLEYSGNPESPLGVSIGIALAAPDEDMTLEKLFAIADQAMYAVKRAGKSSFATRRLSDLAPPPSS